MMRKDTGWSSLAKTRDVASMTMAWVSGKRVESETGGWVGAGGSIGHRQGCGPC